jgi:hypothetical protein
MSSAKLVFAYVCLVGIPLAGVAGILWLGHHKVTAPLSVSGAWDVETDVRASSGNRCLAALERFSQPFLHVSQSGNTLTVRLGNPHKTTVPGIVQNRTLRIGDYGKEAGDCLDPISLRLQAVVQGPRERRTLTGTMAIAGCSTCPLLPFRAVRRTR